MGEDYKSHTAIRPPLGLKSKLQHDMERLTEIKGAINRYLDSNSEIPIEWIEEHNSLIKATK